MLATLLGTCKYVALALQRLSSLVSHVCYQYCSLCVHTHRIVRGCNTSNTFNQLFTLLQWFFAASVSNSPLISDIFFVFRCSYTHATFISNNYSSNSSSAWHFAPIQLAWSRNVMPNDFPQQTSTEIIRKYLNIYQTHLKQSCNDCTTTIVPPTIWLRTFASLFPYRICVLCCWPIRPQSNFDIVHLVFVASFTELVLPPQQRNKANVGKKKRQKKK